MYQTKEGLCFSGMIPGENIEKLPVGIYTINYQGAANVPYLNPEASLITKPLHGESNKIADLVVKYCAASDENLGFLFTGQSGMGKTQTIRNLINLLGYPCIVIDHPVEVSVLIGLTNDAGTPIIVFFDEFEKIFNENSESLLSFFDGITQNRVISFCSMNDSGKLSSYFFNRPGRFIFNFRYDELPVNIALDYINSKTQVADPKRLGDYLGAVYNLSYDLCDKIILLNNRLPGMLEDVLLYINQDIATFQRSAILKIVTSAGTTLLEASEYELNAYRDPELDFNYNRKINGKDVSFNFSLKKDEFIRGQIKTLDDKEVRRRLNIEEETDVEYSIMLSYEKKARSNKSALTF